MKIPKFVFLEKFYDEKRGECIRERRV